MKPEIARSIDIARLAAVSDVLTADAVRTVKEVTDGYRATNNVDQFWARASVRAFVALVEGLIYEYRVILLDLAAGRTFEPSTEELALLAEVSYDLDDRGAPISRPRFLSIERNLRFTYTLFARVIGATVVLDLGGDGFRQFKEAIRIRNRLTHPKGPETLAMSDGDVETVREAALWFSAANHGLLEALSEGIDAHRASHPE